MVIFKLYMTINNENINFYRYKSYAPTIFIKKHEPRCGLKLSIGLFSN